MLCVQAAWQGWSGKTVTQLSDGSVWQQSEYHYEYHYAYRPSVKISGDVMYIDGMSRGVRVKRLREQT